MTNSKILVLLKHYRQIEHRTIVYFVLAISVTGAETQTKKKKEKEISSTNVKRNQSLEQKISKKQPDRALSKTNSILVYNFLFTVCN